MINRILYILYFIKTSNYRYLKEMIQNLSNETRTSKIRIYKSMLADAYKYKCSFMDYFVFGFYNMSNKEKRTYITTGLSYEFFKKVNNKDYINIFKEKTVFNHYFRDFIKRDILDVSSCSLETFLEWCHGKRELILKPSRGVQGKGVKKIPLKNNKQTINLYHKIKNMKDDTYIAEEVIEQQEELNAINPTSVNTLRVITFLKDDQVHVIGAILRIGRDSHLDNFSSGGIAAAVDINKGVIKTRAVSNYTSDVHEIHPETKERILGREIPYWKDILRMVKASALVVPQVRTVGWDIAITVTGPEIIEGNDNWGKDTFQLPYGRGRKNVLEQLLGHELR